MLNEILTPLIANGTTFYDIGYQPWLPFYNFFPIILFAGVVISILTRSAFWGVNFIVSSVMSVLLTLAVYVGLGPDPQGVFIVWSISTSFLIWFQWSVITQRKIWLRRMKADDKHSHFYDDFANMEEYKEHIKIAHPELYEHYFKKTDEEDPEDAD